MKKSLLIAATAVAALALGACNTVAGAGKDVSSAGKAVSKTADDVKN
jgi:predicted small secreted protein